MQLILNLHCQRHVEKLKHRCAQVKRTQQTPWAKNYAHIKATVNIQDTFAAVTGQTLTCTHSKPAAQIVLNAGNDSAATNVSMLR